jgi:ABC-type phosphate/phosphonate transport system substrate-binding protein
LAHNLRKRGLKDVPATLNREIPNEDQWRSGQLLFSQACGYDVLVRANHLRILATPVYTPTACLGGYYSSMVVVREDSRFECLEDLRGSRCAINTPTSHSGMNVLRALFAPMSRNGRFFESVSITGSHEASLMMITDRRADVAAIDCITYALLEQHRSRALREIRVLCCSSRFPAPPYVVGSQVSEGDVDLIRQGLVETLAAPDMRRAKHALLINEVVDLPLQSYQSIADLERCALESQFSEVCSGLHMAVAGRARREHVGLAHEEFYVRP